MKILFLTNTIKPDSGWGRYSSDMILGVKNNGHEVVVSTEDKDNDGFPILKRGLGIFYSAILVRKYLKSCDVVHALDINPYSIIVWLANLFLNKPFIITAVGTYSITPFYNWKTRWLVHSACQSANSIVAISRFVAERLSSVSGLKNIQVINPGIDLQKFKQDHLESETPYILSVGALKHRKGYHISIPAFAAVKNKIPNLQYIIVGSQRDRAYFSRLHDLTKSLGVEADVRFLTNITDEQLADLYQKARVFVLTSVNKNQHFEGYGLVFLEAAAAGLPVVGTLDNGIRDAVGSDNGVLVPQNDIQQTGEALAKILGDFNLWQKMSQASYRWAQGHDLGSSTSKYLLIYNKVVK